MYGQVRCSRGISATLNEVAVQTADCPGNISSFYWDAFPPKGLMQKPYQR